MHIVNARLRQKPQLHSLEISDGLFSRITPQSARLPCPPGGIDARRQTAVCALR